MAGRRIIIKINFNNYISIQEALTKEWIDYRISIFMNYTLKSLKAQTNQDFKAFVLYHPDTEKYIRDALARYEPLPENVHFITVKELNKGILEYIDGYDELYYVYLESDDMYRKDFIQCMYDYKMQDTNNKIILCPYGYMYDSVQNRLVKFYFYAPSFCVCVYEAKAFRDGLRYHFNKGWTSTREYPHEIFKEPCYINHCHGKNSGISFETAERAWSLKTKKDAWDDHPASIKAVFGPEITDKAEIKRILDTFM